MDTKDAERQERTAAEILRRFETQPGVVLADEVGMGKTYVALAVAVSVVLATRRRSQVVVMVPPSVAEKWPREWDVFENVCMTQSRGIRASVPIRRGSDFLRLLDDPPERRKHIIFMTHGALTTNLNDPFIKLSLLRQATMRRPEYLALRPAIAKAALKLLNNSKFSDTNLVATLLETPEARWMQTWNDINTANQLDDDPVPQALLRALPSIDLDMLRTALSGIPKNKTSTYDDRLAAVRAQLTKALNIAWKQSLGSLDEKLPLLILDEAHHVKNDNLIAGLFASTEAERDADALQGALANMFEHMLFLTATPFQLGHGELLSVLSRFSGVRWPSSAVRAKFDAQMNELRKALDAAQGRAFAFERTWSRIDGSEAHGLAVMTSFETNDSMTDSVKTALELGSDTRSSFLDAEKLLQPWVIRHMKAEKYQRRSYKPGASIVKGGSLKSGIAIADSATLPFLLAARAESVAALSGPAGNQSARSYFAYGLASSYEAYRDTRKNRQPAVDDVEVLDKPSLTVAPQLQWYLDRIDRALPTDSLAGASHPKLAATVERVTENWRAGQKTLIFCFYRETGKALRQHISRSIRSEIVRIGAAGLNLDPNDPQGVLDELESISDRLLRSDSRGYQALQEKIQNLAVELSEPDRAILADVVIRFMRTESFLVRYANLSPDMTFHRLLAGFDRTDSSGMTLNQRVSQFAQLLAKRTVTERAGILDRLSRINTGSRATDGFDPAEHSGKTGDREVLLPNVRLANGGVRQETRQNLMQTFNTPFFPEVLVASSVMAEGVDLHLDCRHIIHHDLDWNPATLEQRTGRLDRIGSKAKTTGLPVVIYEPYLAGTHDEKMFTVVKDRERWFGVVMGESMKTDERSTEEQAARVPLPPALASQLTMDLSIAD
ncbi:helicase-related protein [Rhodococcus sp. IEGM 1381]|uniref:helicase-related protein n=1 Tax=Rhodococcus sp. IEGM 1381 TaxID=3047085 RepID=UPI0024B86C69|nr:helicase-related protein [Rhodococcus sp. IEGM 1381]MDI9895998.1 helicase-related protein [Rhodococcus sp. IEGM 1381]